MAAGRWGTALIAAALAAGCAGTPGTPSPGATPAAAATSPASLPGPTPDPRRPLGPPEADLATFGAVEEAWTVAGERVALYDLRERFAGKAAGTATGYYVRVGGRVFGVHWDEAAKHAALAPGTTVNLHGGPNVACRDDASHPTGYRCWRLMRVFPGSRRIPPLTTR